MSNQETMTQEERYPRCDCGPAGGAMLEDGTCRACGRFVPCEECDVSFPEHADGCAMAWDDEEPDDDSDDFPLWMEYSDSQEDMYAQGDGTYANHEPWD